MSTLLPTRAGSVCFAVVQDEFSFYRTFLPASELAKRGFRVSLLKDPDFEALRAFDTVVFETPFTARHESLIRRLKGKVRLVLDLDDNYHSLEPGNPRRAALTSARDIIDRVIETVDEMIVSTEPLREFYSGRCESVTVMPNMLPAELFLEVEPPLSRQGPLRVGWHGGFSHDDDLKILETVLPAVHAEFPAVRFVFFGNAPRLNVPNAEYVQSVPFAAFPATLARLRLDIGLAPLADNPFNRCKTNLKWLEYSALSIPVVAGDVLPYSRSIEQGVDGFLAKTPEDWVRELGRLIRDPELRGRVGRCARERAVERHGCGALGGRYAELASRWAARSAADRPSAAEPVFRSPEVLRAGLLCAAAAMVPLLIVLPAHKRSEVSLGTVVLFAAAVSLFLSTAAILASIRACLVVRPSPARAPKPGLDAEQGLARFLNYHRVRASLHHVNSRVLLPAAAVSILGLIPLAIIRSQSLPWLPMAVFCVALPEAAILAFAFSWTSSMLSSRLPAPPVLPLDSFIRPPEESDERFSKRLRPAPPGAVQRVLNVGACSKEIPMPPHFEGWAKVYLDVVPGPGVDIVADARDMPSVESGGFDAVYFSHCLEHFDPWEAEKVLKELARVLKPGGVLEVHVPNILEVCRRIAAGQPIDGTLYGSAAGPIAPLDMFYGCGRFVKGGRDFMRHKAAYTPDSLAVALERSGFAVDSMRGMQDFDLSVIALKTP